MLERESLNRVSDPMEEWKGIRRKIAFVACICGLATLASAQEGETLEPVFPPPPELRAVPDFYVEVADTDTRVFIAEVNLKVGNLILSSGETPELVGTYEIDVPIRSSKDDVGAMVLPLNRPLAHYLEEGGVLTGIGRSYKRPEIKREIVCEIRPDPENARQGAINLSVDTGNRVMKFKTTYQIVGDIPRGDEMALAVRNAPVGVLPSGAL